MLVIVKSVTFTKSEFTTETEKADAADIYTDGMWKSERKMYCTESLL